MKRTSSCYLLFLLVLWTMPQFNLVVAQNKQQLDSLRNLLPSTRDTTRVSVLNEIAYLVYQHDPQEANRTSSTAIELAKKINHVKGLARGYDLKGRSHFQLNDLNKTLENYIASAEYYKTLQDTLKMAEEYNEIGVIYKNMGEYVKALDYYAKVLKLIEHRESSLTLANTLMNIGQSYSYLGYHEKSIEYFIKAIRKWEDLDDKTGLALAYGNLGNLYYNLKEYSMSLEYYQMAQRFFAEDNNQKSLASILNNIGLIYNNFSDNETALEYFESAKTLSIQIDFKSGHAFALSNIGRVYQDMQQYDEAIENFKAAIEIFKQINNKSAVSGRLNDLGEVYTLLGRYDEAREKLYEGLQIALEINDTERELISYKALFEYYEAVKEYNLSLDYYKRYAALKDSVFNIQKSGQITEIQTRYETEKKEQENELLRKEKAIREETISRKEAQNRLLLIGILFILSFAGYFYIVNRQKQKTNLLLRKQNEEINLKQQEIIKINADLQQSQYQLSKANEELQYLNSTLESTVRERTAALQKSNVELDTFLYQSSHALRRPIVSIMGLIQIARLEKDRENMVMIWDKVEDTATKMDLMLRKLVMASEINIAQFDPYKIIDIQTVIEETWDSIQGNLPTQNISFHSDIAPIKNFCTKEVPFRIALYNILENAVLYACELSPEVKILAKKQGDRIYVEILDNGVGIPAELTERIFDMFIVAMDQPKGFGLGLYIAKKAIDKLEGNIDVLRKGNYTSFVMTIPYPSKNITS